MGKLTTHVLDTALGRPAHGLALTLAYLSGGDRRTVASARTNADGRTDAPLVSGPALLAGVYEITFEAGAYLRAAHGLTAEPLFLETIPIRFGVAAPDAHFHVPLLLSPYGYSTYRGS